jgi:hypothetical protein
LNRRKCCTRDSRRSSFRWRRTNDGESWVSENWHAQCPTTLLAEVPPHALEPRGARPREHVQIDAAKTHSSAQSVSFGWQGQ